MGLVILFFLGAVAGWLATIMLQAHGRQGLAPNVVVGILGALLAGMLTNQGSVLDGISAASLVSAFAGSIAFLAIHHLIKSRITL